MIKNTFTLILAFTLSTASIGQTICDNGFADIYPCHQIDLMSILENSVMDSVSGLNDIWGWVDPLDGKEYALVGAIEGTAFVDVSDPLAPIYLGQLPTHTVASTWRDMKVFSDHVFIVSEASGHGMQVFDLDHLRNLNPADLPMVFEEDAHYPGFGNCHNIAINEETGFAYAIGTNTFAGGPHFVDINDPLNPVAAGGFEAEGYTHDAQIVIYHGPDSAHHCKEILVGNNGNNGAPLVIVDVTEKDDPMLISGAFYDSLGYSHQGWLTGDHRFFLHNDETDEISFGFNTRTHMWNVMDLDAPIYLGYFESTSSASDHNLYIKGDYCYQSNYRAGLRVLDVSDVENANLEEVAFFDVFHQHDNVNTGGGTWSNYPYFPSGNIIVTHRQVGLFVVRPKDSVLIDSWDDDYSDFCDTDSVPDGIEEYGSEPQFSVFPNPSTGVFQVDIDSDKVFRMLTISDMMGRVIYSIDLRGRHSAPLQIDLSAEAKGIYQLSLQGDRLSSRKLIID